MITYNYECPDCKYVEELQHKISEEPIVMCPECCEVEHVVQMQRIIVLSNTGNGFVLKGPCWSRDGYKK